jgi:hypothetical protein
LPFEKGEADMSDKNQLIALEKIQNRIFTIRGIQVMVDRDLAELYQVETKVLNQAVKRNIERFPDSFRFQLNAAEKNELVTNCDRFENLKHSSINPYAFTEHGVSMLSAVLRSDIAIKISIQIMNAFVEMRKFITNNAGLFQRLDKVELKQLEADQKFEQIFNALENGSVMPKQGIFFDGQVFDAYQFVSDLIRSAAKSILLIDNYIDDTVLTHFAKRKKDVAFVVLTKAISRQLELDAKKFNAQYPPVILKEFNNAHDRFIIIDETTIYHFGASLKDLGKKWFAFSKMDVGAAEMLETLKKMKL